MPMSRRKSKFELTFVSFRIYCARFMESSKRNTVQSGLRSIISLTVITAILLSGLCLVIVGFSNKSIDKEPTAYCEVFFPTEDGSMDKTEPFSDGKSFFLTVPAVIFAPNVDSIKPSIKDQKFAKIRKINDSRYIKLSTTASISSKKALEFTLVGAKPSGTG